MKKIIKRIIGALLCTVMGFGFAIGASLNSNITEKSDAKEDAINIFVKDVEPWCSTLDDVDATRTIVYEVKAEKFTFYFEFLLLGDAEQLNSGETYTNSSGRMDYALDKSSSGSPKKLWYDSFELTPTIDISNEVTGLSATVIAHYEGETTKHTYNLVYAEGFYYIVDRTPDNAHGSISFNKVFAEENETITVTVAPDDGYKLKSLKYYDTALHFVTKNETSGNYEFKMPASNVEILALFELENPYYSFNFNTNAFENGWTTIDADGDGHDWNDLTGRYWITYSSTAGIDGSACAISLSYSNDTYSRLNSNNWMFSPAITIPLGGAVVSWYEQSLDSDFLDSYSVYVSDENTSTDPNDMTVICEKHGAKGRNETGLEIWKQIVVELSGEDYGGKTVYIAFQHKDYDKFVLQIDDFAVQEIPTITNGTSVSDSEINHGYLDINKKSALVNSVVTINTRANPGFKLRENSIVVSYNDGVEKTCTVTHVGGDEYSFVMPNYPVTVKAAFEPIPSYFVTFDTKGIGSPIPDLQYIMEGGKIAKPLDPSAEGFSFDGWYADPDFYTPWNFDIDTVTHDTTLFAKWVGDTHNVIFDKNTGDTDATPSSILQTNGERYILPGTNPTKDGHLFAGWYTYADGGEQITSDTIFFATGDKTLFAHWLDHVHAPATSYPQVDATCCADGCKAYYLCSCGLYFSDSACTEEITDFSTWLSTTAVIPATGEHTYGDPVYSWEGRLAHASCSCTNPDCTEVKEYVCLGDYVKDTDATCLDDEKGHFVGKFAGTSIEPLVGEANSVVIPGTAKGHDIADPVYSWDEDKCTAIRACKNCDYKEEETVEGVYVADFPATCGQNEFGHLEAVFESPKFEAQSTEIASIEVPETAKTHNYILLGYMALGDTGAEFAICENCFDFVSEIVDGIFVMDTPATCETNAFGHYLFEFENEIFVNVSTVENSVELYGTALGHDYGEPVYEWNNNVLTATSACTREGCTACVSESADGKYIKDTDATCTSNEKGHYEAVLKNEMFAGVYETDANSVEIQNSKVDHIYSETTYVWSTDGKSCSAYKKCIHCVNKVEEAAKVTSIQWVAPTCTTEGVTRYTADFKNFSTDYIEIKNIKKLDHRPYGQVFYDDTNSYQFCGDCGAIVNSKTHNLVTTYSWSKTAEGTICVACTKCKDCGYHNDENGVITVTVVSAATCEKAGSNTLTATFAKAASTTSTQVVDALGHNYGTVAYSWNGDTCTATVSCKNTGCIHGVTETKKGTLVVDYAATCSTNAKGHYSVKFGDSKLGSVETGWSTTEIDGTKLGHTYSKVTYTWSKDLSECTAEANCDSGDSCISETVKTVKDGNKYTATFENLAFGSAVQEKEFSRVALIIIISASALVVFYGVGILITVLKKKEK